MARSAHALLRKQQKNFYHCLKTLNGVKVFDLESTYLAWVDFSKLNITETELKRMLVKDAGIAPSFGSGFGKSSGKFARFNIACRKDILDLAIDRLTKTFYEFLVYLFTIFYRRNHCSVALNDKG